MYNIQQGLLSLLFPDLGIDKISSLFFKVINKKSYSEFLAFFSSHSLASKRRYVTSLALAA